MGHLYLEPRSGRWYAAYRTSDGSWRRRSTHAPSKTLARQILHRWEIEEAEKRVGGAKACPDIPFRRFAALYLKHARATKTRQSARRDRVVIRNVLPVFGRRLLKDVRHRDVQAYLDQRLTKVFKSGKRIHPSTVDRERIALSALFTFAVDNEYLPLDAHPVKRIKLPKGEKFRQRELTPDEEASLVRICRTRPHLAYLEPIILTALNTGLRLGELLALRWGNVDLTVRELPGGTTSHGRITVESTNDSPTKARTTRFVPINRDLHKILDALRLAVLCEANATPGAIRGRTVFENPETGTRWVDIGNAWDSALEHAGITGFRFHDLRHTFATRARRAGMPLEVLQKILGHSTIDLTMRYSHVGEEEMDEAINLMCRPLPVAQGEGSAKVQAGGKKTT